MESNENLNVYHSDLPYPELKVTEKNEYYASLIKNDYAGFVSELTSFCQYNYHHLVDNDVDPEIADMLRNIAIVEMYHMDALGVLIVLLGGDPTYLAENNYWNGDYIYTGTNLLERLEADLQNEYDAIENYEKNIAQIDDPYVKNVLKRIVLDEEVHVKLFEKAIEKVKESQNPKITLEDAINEAFPKERYK